MARKKQLDKLSLDMIECEKAGFGVSYGRWKATQKPVEYVKDDSIPEGWLVCRHCGKPFKPNSNRKQYYCEAVCQVTAQYKKMKQRKKEQQNESNA
jgi:hypothetical protein